jgi:hypothetical protein
MVAAGVKHSPSPFFDGSNFHQPATRGLSCGLGLVARENAQVSTLSIFPLADIKIY